jgi:hypothetical protein
MASSQGRFLLIHWTKPAPLETFLLPPQLGLDWRFPPWLLDEFHQDDNNRLAPMESKIINYGANPQVRWVRAKYQSHNHGQEYYDRNRVDAKDPTYAQVYHDLWRVCFTPAPAIAGRIETQMEGLGLIPGRYVSTHIRALYGVEKRENNLVLWWTRNAIHCVTAKFPVSAPRSTIAMPILFVSDSTYATEMASAYAQQQNIQGVVHRNHNGQQPLHLEKNVNSRNLEDFYDTFVDVYMIAMSRCTAYNMGGYGRWGSMMGYNSSCVFFMKANMIACDLYGKGRVGVLPPPAEALPKPLFLPPMPASQSSKTTTVDAIVTPNNNGVDNPKVDASIKNVVVIQNMTQLMHDDPFLYAPFDDTSKPNLWRGSKKIPAWMKKYFRWHTAQRHHNLNPQNWTSMRYLVMQCLEHHPRCGGTSDRLKSLPTMLRMASVTKRFLLIHWKRPAKLEEFLLPPKGGFDWRVPDWLRK